MQQTPATSPHHDDPHLLILEVAAPRDPKPKPFTFRDNDTVEHCASIVAAEFAYAPGNFSLQKPDGQVLQRDKTLAAEHVHNQERFELVEAGGGV